MPRPQRMPQERVDFLLSVRQPRDLDDERDDDGRESAPPDEAESRWGHADVWAQAAGRVGDYGLDEWLEISGAQRDWEHRVADLMATGAAASGTAAADLAEEQRQSIERWYFTCPPTLHVEVVDALLGDPGFRARYEELAAGAADFIRAAVHANAARRRST